MNPIKLALALAAAALLAGCGTQTVTVYKTSLISPPDNLLLDCPVAVPPDGATYKAAGEGVTHEQAADKREQMLFEHAAAQMANIGSCNVRLKALRDWKQRQEQLQKDADANKGK